MSNDTPESLLGELVNVWAEYVNNDITTYEFENYVEGIAQRAKTLIEKEMEE